jgi:hypothetical protein
MWAVPGIREWCGHRLRRGHRPSVSQAPFDNRRSVSTQGSGLDVLEPVRLQQKNALFEIGRIEHIARLQDAHELTGCLIYVVHALEAAVGLRLQRCERRPCFPVARRGAQNDRYLAPLKDQHTLAAGE